MMIEKRKLAKDSTAGMLKQIGEFQSVPAEEIPDLDIPAKNLARRSLYIDQSPQAGEKRLVTLSNRDESGANIILDANIIREIKIQGERELVNRTLSALIKALEDLEGNPVIRVPNSLKKEDTPEKRLVEYKLKVKRSRHGLQDIFFILQGIEKEDIATEPPFKIEMEEGDFIAVNRTNMLSLITALKS